MTRTIAALLLATCVVLAPAASPAMADHRQQTIFDATNDLLRAETVAARQNVLDQLQQLGVDTVRIAVPWRSIVPSPDTPHMPEGFDPADPADYGGGVLNSIDESIRGAAARGMRVLLTPTGPIPDWASASGDGPVADPEPAAFEQLLVALGRRYGGDFGSECLLPPRILCLPGQRGPIPRVGAWSIWSEPNQSLFLQPQYRDGKPYSPLLYRRLFLAARRGLAASGHRGDDLLIGETAPSGGRDGVNPIDFIRGVLCLNRAYRRTPGCAPIAAQGWAHHPYSVGDPPYQRTANPNLISMATIGRMVRALRRAAWAGATRAQLPIYVTEYGVESVPDSDGVSLARQAEYIAIGEYLMWRNPRVRSYAQYLLADDRPADAFAFQSGLRTSSGAKKPSYRAFRIALVVRKSAGRLRFWGHVRPGGGVRKVTVQVRRGTTIRPLRRSRTDQAGYFHFSLPAGRATSWRATCKLPTGAVLTGPFVHAHSF